MRKVFLISVLILFIGSAHGAERIPFRDTCEVIQVWRQPPAVPLPTLDHHLGKVTASVGLFSLLSLSGIEQSDAVLITSGAALAFEAIQVAFFSETVRHALNDMVLFSFHIPTHLFLRRDYIAGAFLTLNLTGIYLTLLPATNSPDRPNG